jgi:hypothetical protein
MPILLPTQLDLERCPHCNVDRPSLKFNHQLAPKSFEGHQRYYRIYVCLRCGGAVTAEASGWEHMVSTYFPSGQDVSIDVPERPRTYLLQAIGSLSAPAGAVMLAASSVDAMLKAKSLSAGSLYARIETAAKTHLITEDMSKWAHEVRLDANDQRHADTAATLPSTQDAQKCIDFVLALAQVLFVLPARIQRGISNATAE